MRPVLIAALFLFFFVVGRVNADEGRVAVVIDPRIELVSAAMSQSDWVQARSGFFSPYAKEAQQQFFSYREHVAVQDLNLLRIRGVRIEGLLRWVLSLSPPPDLQPPSPPDERITRPAGCQTALDKLAADLRQFARESGFAAFFDRHQPFYESLVRDYTAL